MAEKGLTAAEVRRRAGLNQTGLYDILHGRSQNPRLDTIEKIAIKGLGVPVWWLLREEQSRSIDDQLNCALDLLPLSSRKMILRMAEALISEPESEHDKGAED